MNYQETLQYLFTALPMYQRIGETAYKADLENAWYLDQYFGEQHKLFKSIHVGGTNGKGSVSHMLAAVLQSAGYKTGLFTSPHIYDFRERIKVNGEEISEDFVVKFTEDHRAVYEEIKPSFFEMTVFMAFAYFAWHKVDYAVIEVGLGGRLDTTNIIRPEISVITNIGLDHTHILGNTVQSIAVEKAGIIKPQIPVIIGETQDATNEIFIDTARGKNSPICFADQEFMVSHSEQNPDGSVSWHYRSKDSKINEQMRLDLPGLYQKKNLATVLAALRILEKQGVQMKPFTVKSALKNVRELTGLNGRWQITGQNPLIVCDVAHNKDGFEEVIAQLKITPSNNLHLILGFVNDKNVEDIVKLLPPDACFYLCEPSIPRAMKTEVLSPVFTKLGLPHKVFPCVVDAYCAARETAISTDVIYIGGSTFVVSDFLQWKKNNNPF
jgi:dihydrofolate synthase / folylpolyglutamate synthase